MKSYAPITRPRWLLAALFLLVLALPRPASAQVAIPIDNETYTDIGCDGESHTINYSNAQFDGTTLSFTAELDGERRSFRFDPVADGPSEAELDNLSEDDYGQGMLSLFEGDYRNYAEFVLGGLGCLGGFGGIDGSMVTANPIVNQSVQTLRSAAFSKRAQPRALTAATAAADEEDGDNPRPPQEVSSDLEYEYFSASNLSGNNLTIRGGYARATADGQWNYGGNLIHSRLSFDGSTTVSNNNVHFFANRLLSADATQETYVGANLNLMLLEGTDNGVGLSVHAVRRWYLGERIFTLGALIQRNGVGDLTSLYTNLAVLYGFPVGQKMSLNFDGMVLINVYQGFAGESMDVEDRFILNPGVNLTYLVSDLFGINVGLKTVLLAQDYSSAEFTFGGTYRF